MDYNEHLASVRLADEPRVSHGSPESPWHLPHTSKPVRAVMTAGRLEQTVEDGTVNLFTAAPGPAWRPCPPTPTG
jgi:hypothetical protein